MKSIFTAFVLCAALSCSGSAGTDMPQWRWEDPVPSEGPEAVEPHPAIVALGWTNISASFPAVPEGIAIYRSPEQLGGQKVVATIAVADLSKVSWDVRSIDDPTIQGTDQQLKTPSAWFTETAAPVVLNGGYFFVEGGKRYNASVAVSESRTYGVNLNYASQDWVTMYYPTRGVFHQTGNVMETGWTYWSGGAQHYLYSKPAENAWDAAPLPIPDANFPAQAKVFAPVTAIGGGPVLLKSGETVNSWKAEMFYGNGADDKMPLERHPRTAIGATDEGLLILFVCEGRNMTKGVAGMTFAEEAEVLKSLGCTEALNLDGGGSSCLLVQGLETIIPSDGAQRPVASVVILKTK